MKYYSCPICHREKFYKEGLVMVLCPGCMEEMKIKEVDEDGKPRN